MRLPLPISPKYDSAIYEALAVQVVVGVLGLLVLDGGMTAQICGIALLAFWSGVGILIYRHPHTPSKADLALIRVGYFPVLVISFSLACGIWRLRGLQ